MKPIKDHINRFGLVAAAMGLAFGHTASEFISTIVSTVALPMISLLIGVDDWKTHVLLFGPLEIKWGEVLRDSIRLIIVAISVFYVLHWLNVDQEK